MALDLTLGGARRRWRLRGEDSVETWARDRPWLGEGGTLSLVVGGQYDRVRSWLRRTLWAWDAGASNLRFVEMTVAGREALTGELRAWLGTTRADLYTLAKGIGADLAYRPAVFLLAVPDAGAAGGVADLTEELRDWIVKLDFARAPAFVVLHGGHVGVARGCVSADVGWPHGIVEDLFDAPTTEERWSLYIHLRIAYEAAGRLDDAIALDSSELRQVPCENDGACERALNDHAIRRFAALDDDEAQRWRARARVGRWQGEPPLPLAGVPWVSATRATPAPWLARALLLEPNAGSSRRLLRAEIVCHPLAEALLNVCFALEAAQRARIDGAFAAPPDDQAVAQYERFAAGLQSATRDIYPVGHPALPADAWDFASLGVVQRVVAGPPDLLYLRNALAHGHYASWEAFCRVHALRRRAGW